MGKVRAWNTSIRKRPSGSGSSEKPNEVSRKDHIKDRKIRNPKYKRLKRCDANPSILFKKLIHRCICGKILCYYGFSHRQYCGKFYCDFIDDNTYDETKKKINKFRLFIEELNKINLNLNIKNIILKYLKPSCEVFEDRINILEIQMSNYDDKCQEYKKICKELQFLNQYK